MEKPDVIYQLRHSLEMDTIKRDILMFAGGLGIPALIMLYSEYVFASGVFLGLILLGILGFYICRILSIFRNPEGYILAECTLSQPHSRHRSFYFTISFPLPDGQPDIVNTHAIFAEGGIFEPVMEDYVNKTAWIAYNPSTGMVVVIG